MDLIVRNESVSLRFGYDVITHHVRPPVAVIVTFTLAIITLAVVLLNECFKFSHKVTQIL